MDRAGPEVLRYTATKGKDVAAGQRGKTGGEGGSNTDWRRLTVTQEAFSSFPNHPNFALGIAQGESIRGHPRLTLPSRDILVGDLLLSVSVGGYAVRFICILLCI